MGTLYLVATPIGNLEDITYRAVRVLQEVDLIAAEDTRHSGRLLKQYGIETPLISFHGHSPESQMQRILKELERRDVALITDAGMPAVSDPGSQLVRAAVERNVRVEVIPGPSSVTAAVAASGLVDSGFLFAGYPPRRQGERARYFARLALASFPIVLFESPHRLRATLDDLRNAFPDASVAICRELTKLHETIVRGSIEDVHQHFQGETPRGEFVLVLAAVDSVQGTESTTDAEVVARRLIEQGLSTSAAAREIAGVCGISRSDAYTLVMRIKDEEAK